MKVICRRSAYWCLLRSQLGENFTQSLTSTCCVTFQLPCNLQESYCWFWMGSCHATVQFPVSGVTVQGLKYPLSFFAMHLSSPESSFFYRILPPPTIFATFLLGPFFLSETNSSQGLSLEHARTLFS